MANKKLLAKIYILSACIVAGVPTARGKALAVPKDVSERDARYLIGIGKAKDISPAPAEKPAKKATQKEIKEAKKRLEEAEKAAELASDEAYRLAEEAEKTDDANRAEAMKKAEEAKELAKQALEAADEARDALEALQG